MNLLAVRTHAFGDALMCTPAVAALSTVHAVSVLTGPSALPVWSRMPGIESVITAPIPANPLSLLFWTMSHRLAGFDRVIFFGVSPVLRRWLRLMTRAAMRSGADLPLGSWEEAVGFGEKPAALAFSRIAGVAPESLRPVFPLKDQEKAIAGKMAEQGSYAVIAPGGGRNPRQSVSAKRISPEKWREGIVFLRGKGYKVLGVGAAGDRETVAAAGVDVNLAGSCSWGVTAALIAGAAVFAGNDSGPAHLAVAHEVPTVVVFGPTDPDSLYPADSIIPVKGTALCSPCYSKGIFPGCGRGFLCMSSVEARQIVEALKKVFS